MYLTLLIMNKKPINKKTKQKYAIILKIITFDLIKLLSVFYSFVLNGLNAKFMNPKDLTHIQPPFVESYPVFPSYWLP